jgi:hypothetical protein
MAQNVPLANLATGHGPLQLGARTDQGRKQTGQQATTAKGDSPPNFQTSSQTDAG